MTRQDLIDIGYDDVVLLEPEYLDSAIDSISHDRRVIYDYDKLLEAFIENNDFTEENAIEWVEYNVINSLVFDGCPIIKYNLNN